MVNPTSLIMAWTGTANDANNTIGNNIGYSFAGFMMCNASTNANGNNPIPSSQGFQDGIFTQLQVRVTTASTTNFIASIDGLSTANNTVSIAQNTTGLSIDNTHSDTVTGNKSVFVFCDTASAATIISLAGFTFQATTAGNTVTRHGFWNNNNLTNNANVNYFAGLGYSNTTNTTEANAKMRMRKSFTIKNLGGAESSNTATLTVSSRKNGAAGALTATSNGANPSIFSDTSHSDSVIAGDDWNFQFNNTGTSYNGLDASVDLISTNGDCPFFCSNNATTSISTAVTNYFGLTGSLVTGVTTESKTQVQVNSTFLFTQLLINTITNGNTGVSTFNLRANNSNVISISIGGTTGIHLDSSSSYTAATTDLMNYQIVTGSTGGAMTISQISVNGNITTAAAGGPSYQHFDNSLKPTTYKQAYNAFGGQLTIFG